MGSRRTAESPLYKSSYNQYSQENEGSESKDIVIHVPQTALMTQDRYISSRTDAVRSIESTIADLQGIFQQLANLVAEQGEMIQRIDDNIENTSSNVSNAQRSLMQYMSNSLSNRWLIIKMFIVLIVFVILFIVFFV